MINNVIGLLQPPVFRSKLANNPAAHSTTVSTKNLSQVSKITEPILVKVIRINARISVLKNLPKLKDTLRLG